MKRMLCVYALTLVASLCVVGVQAGQGEGPASGPRSSAYEDVKKWMAETKQRTGLLPGYAAMSARMRETRSGRAPQETTALWREWRAAQHPAITEQELVRMAVAKRSSIQTARMVYSVAWQKSDGRTVLSPYNLSTESFLMDRDRLRVDRQRGTTQDDLSDKTVMAYDGQVVRTLLERRGGASEASVQALTQRSFFFDLLSPLARQMLLDAAHDQGEPTYLFGDLAAFLTGLGGMTGYVSETPETVDGRQAIACVLGTVPESIVWLDTERNFAVLKVESNRIEWATVAGESFAADVSCSSVVEASDFIDCGNGLWMPKKIVERRFAERDGAAFDEMIVTTVSSVDLNGHVDDREFTDIFPPGTLVRDALTGTRYTTGSLDDAEKSLARTIDALKDGLDVDTETTAETASRASAAGGEQPAIVLRERDWQVWVIVGAGVLVVLGAAGVYRLRRNGQR